MTEGVKALQLLAGYVSGHTRHNGDGIHHPLEDCPMCQAVALGDVIGDSLDTRDRLIGSGCGRPSVAIPADYVPVSERAWAVAEEIVRDIATGRGEVGPDLTWEGHCLADRIGRAIDA